MVLAELLSVDIKEDDVKNEKFLVNMLHFGDILFNTDRTHFLLCVTPPCDTYRPHKTEFNISYIAGKLVEGEIWKDKLKESEHISLYPGDSDVKYIMWHLYEGVRFDLKDKSQYETLRSYTREYRMDEQYARQIANKYLAYCSRAGVNEIFTQERDLLRGVWN